LRLKNKYKLYLYLKVVIKNKRFQNNEISVVYILIINIMSKSYNVVNKDLFKLIINIINYKQYMLQKLTISILITETAITKEVL